MITGKTDSEETAPEKRSDRLRVQDLAWVAIVAVLIATMPETNYNAIILLILIAAFQIAEPRIQLFSSPHGQAVSIVFKLLLSYVLIGYTHGIDSYYYEFFLIPVVSAAANLALPGVVLVTSIACLAYPSFLLPIFIDYDLFHLTPDQINIICLRVAFYAIVAFAVYQEASAKRDETRRTQLAAERLAESNRNLRRAEATLRRNERLAALGQLTAGLAHELRNPLGTIRASAEMLSKPSTQQKPELMSEMSGFIRSEVDRMNGLISSFLDFARPLQIRPIASDLDALLHGVVNEQMKRADERHVRLVTDVKPASLSFDFDPDLLRVAVSNLVQNAVQASHPGGEVTVTGREDHDNVKISVLDHGEGISRESLESIFNPFFTTKPEGTGLGLAIVAKIIDEHGGRIEVSSETGSGTEFELSLPKVNRI
ncbi:MAG: ATP-binding protein [Acidobacteriaceae bacterium]|nr:ATP-binding protein [Acidobacteriaceae bacterium]